MVTPGSRLSCLAPIECRAVRSGHRCTWWIGFSCHPTGIAGLLCTYILGGVFRRPPVNASRTDGGAGKRIRRYFAARFPVVLVDRRREPVRSQASGLALPILVLGVGGSALAAGVLGTVAALADAVLAPFAGVVADRHSRRSMLVVSALVAGCAMGAVAAGVVTHAASLTLLCCAAVVEGAATAGYAAAAAGAIKPVLPAERPERALGALQSREQAARLAGPGWVVGSTRWRRGRRSWPTPCPTSSPRSASARSVPTYGRSGNPVQRRRSCGTCGRASVRVAASPACWCAGCRRR